jgi:hypothetical protein
MSTWWESNIYISVWNTLHQIWISGVFVLDGPTSLSSQLHWVKYTVLFTTCKETSNIWIQVSQCKIIFRYILGTWNFTGFIRFFQKGLNPFKIQARFKFELFLDFLLQNTEGFGSGAKKRSCSLLSHWSPQNVSPFLDIGKIVFVNFEVGDLEKWIKLKGTEGPHFSHHGVFWPRAPAVATGPPPLPMPPCPTPPRPSTIAALILSALSAKPYLPSSYSWDLAPYRSTSLPHHRAPPLSILVLLLLLFFVVPLPPTRHLKHHRATVLVCQESSSIGASPRAKPSPQEVAKAEPTPSALAVRAPHRQPCTSGHPPAQPIVPQALPRPRAARRQLQLQPLSVLRPLTDEPPSVDRPPPYSSRLGEPLLPIAPEMSSPRHRACQDWYPPLPATPWGSPFPCFDSSWQPSSKLGQPRSAQRNSRHFPFTLELFKSIQFSS